LETLDEAQQDHTPQREFSFSDNFGDLFSVYLERALVEDKNMVESWKEEADGTLVFVGLQTTSHTSAYNVEIIDWSILCCGRGIARTVRPECSAEPAGHISHLSRKH
jgi:hypothetical protein